MVLFHADISYQSVPIKTQVSQQFSFNDVQFYVVGVCTTSRAVAPSKFRRLFLVVLGVR